MTQYLEFEKPLSEIEGKAEELRAMARENPESKVEKEAETLDQKAADLLVQLSKGFLINILFAKLDFAKHYCSLETALAK